jgi:hypothetical protein
MNNKFVNNMDIHMKVVAAAMTVVVDMITKAKKHVVVVAIVVVNLKKTVSVQTEHVAANLAAFL